MSYSVLNDLTEAMKVLDGKKQDGVGEVACSRPLWLSVTSLFWR